MICPTGSALFVNSRPLDNSLATPERGPESLQPQALGFLNRVDPLDSVNTVWRKIFTIFATNDQNAKIKNREIRNRENLNT